MTHWLFSLVTLTILGADPGGCYKGLLVMTSGSKSNMNFFGSIVEALSESGHEITFITPFDTKESRYRKESQRIVIQDERDSYIGNKFEVGLVGVLDAFYKYIARQCLNVLADPRVQEALNQEYDYVMLALVGTDCFLGYTYEKKLPLIYLFQNELFFTINERFGVPIFPVLSPASIMGHAYPTTLWQRVKEQSVELLMRFVFGLLIKHRIEADCRERKLWNSTVPSIDTLYRQPEIIFVNSIQALEYPPKALPPNVIYAGGIHINPSASSLDGETKDWLDDSGKSGFIYFSLGTSVRSEDMTEKNFATLMKVFGSLKQRVLFKWHSETLPDLPKNVRVSPWVPQQAVLSHSKIRAFVTHGGLFSIIEATYFKVPIVGIPVYMDQSGNVAKAVAEGWAKRVEWGALEEEILRSAIEEVIQNKIYREVVNRRSKLMQAWPKSPKKEVVAWINYSVKYQELTRMRMPLDNHYWFQLLNLDVWAVIVFTTGFSVCFVFVLFRLCFKFCRKSMEKLKRD